MGGVSFEPVPSSPVPPLSCHGFKPSPDKSPNSARAFVLAVSVCASAFSSSSCCGGGSCFRRLFAPSVFFLRTAGTRTDCENGRGFLNAFLLSLEGTDRYGMTAARVVSALSSSCRRVRQQAWKLSTAHKQALSQGSALTSTLEYLTSSLAASSGVISWRFQGREAFLSIEHLLQHNGMQADINAWASVRSCFSEVNALILFGVILAFLKGALG
jgi:hypothetical protein